MDSLEWQTVEYLHRPKTPDWFWAVGVITLSISVTSFIFNNFLFALIILIGTGTLMIYAARKPLTINIAINERGVRMGKELYPYSSLESFCIAEEGYPRIILHAKALLTPLVVIALENMNSEEVKTYLKNHLEEKEIRESFLEILMEKIGF